MNKAEDRYLSFPKMFYLHYIMAYIYVIMKYGAVLQGVIKGELDTLFIPFTCLIMLVTGKTKKCWMLQGILTMNQRFWNLWRYV